MSAMSGFIDKLGFRKILNEVVFKETARAAARTIRADKI
jgi:hypothetical protein